jgi:transcriptional regulator with XRE-family HTH domain
MSEWTGERIKRLRVQLGWSRAEMGRRLSMDWEGVQALEENVGPHIKDLAMHLDRMKSYLDSYRRQQKYEPIAEVLLRELRLDQIEAQEVNLHYERNFKVDN